MPQPAPNEMIAAAIRRERAKSGLSLSALAEAAGLAKSTLSQLESGRGNPSIETLWAIATALGVPFSFLFETPTPDVTLVRADEGHGVGSDHAAYHATLLAPCPPGLRRDIYRVELAPGTPRRSEPHPPGTVEHCLLVAGEARIGPAGAEEILHPGDYYRYPADMSHVYEALAPATRLVMVMESRG
ncbi:anaerobic benzoate catabolism transcriptional regulator [Pseudoruegeria aquimaris]|uniref:Anaerobic benzoate catabolism transcriptional regulator n=1 Tax=Pseudoruegeria aquimaris TaxID=393663 RepID=A0A1Y5RJ06_9RHOB|nr:XRE family transcriptional regulator [Pseudoruegeria aquimaris]SLN17555.1 anaerobic benzoate catabolism transcriptional regulator [Pseudoruegeria aquimaris]